MIERERDTTNGRQVVVGYDRVGGWRQEEGVRVDNMDESGGIYVC